MSWLSNQLSSVADITKRNILQPVANTYNRNKSAILDAAAMAAIAAATGGAGAFAAGAGAGGIGGAAGLGAGAGLIGGSITGAGQDAARHDQQRQLNNKAGAAADLTGITTGIGGPSTGTGLPTTPVVMDPTTGNPVPITDPAAKPLIDGGQVPLDPSTGQPASGVGGTLTGTSPGTAGQNTAITGNAPTSNGAVPVNQGSSNIAYNMGQTDPALQARLGQILGTGNTEAEISANQVQNANDLATQLSTQTLNTQAADRKQQIADLSTLLTQQAQTQYERSLPSLYEDLNTRGLLRSSDLGNQMATKEQQSYQDVANQLGQTQLGYNDQYITGLGNITNSYNAGTGSALQREQSLQDYANQVQASLKLGQAVTPVQPSGKTGTSTATNAIGLTSALGSLGTGLSSKTKSSPISTNSNITSIGQLPGGY